MLRSWVLKDTLRNSSGNGLMLFLCILLSNWQTSHLLNLEMIFLAFFINAYKIKCLISIHLEEWESLACNIKTRDSEQLGHPVQLKIHCGVCGVQRQGLSNNKPTSYSPLAPMATSDSEVISRTHVMESIPWLSGNMVWKVLGTNWSQESHWKCYY